MPVSSFEEGIDPELRAEFIDESLDGLQRVAALLVDLEANPDKAETVQAIFRPVHSIKGNSAYFGLLQTKSLAHELESLLDLVRKGALSPDATVVGVLLQGTDDLAAMLGRVRGGQAETPDPAAVARLLEEIREITRQEKVDETSLWLSLLEKIQSLDNPALLNQARRLAQSGPAGRKALGQKEEPRSSTDHWPEAAKKLAARMADGSSAPSAAETRPLLEACLSLGTSPEIETLATKIRSDFDVLVRTVGLGDPVSRSLIPKHLAKLFPASAVARPNPSRKIASSPPPVSPAAPAPVQQESKTMRVPEERIDAFLAHVGELVTISEMYSHLYVSLSAGADSQKSALELRRINESFDQLSLALQHSIMQIRKLPIAGILSRMPRLVRDIADARGKQIETVITGEEIMVDKSLVDALDAPLTHMVRNAADHGVELPAERQAAGKTPRGKISVAVTESADDIVLAVSDDGRGIDRRALADKAIKLGLLSPDATLSDADMIQLLFMSGVSTAKEVTDVSGRGVGMDVVKRAVDELGGRIDVASQPGLGTLMHLRLPKTVTTQILDGFIVIADGARYVFPLKNIQRCFRPSPSDLSPVQGKGLCVKDGRGLLRVLRLAEYLGTRPEAGGVHDIQDGIMVVVEGAEQTVAVHVDGIDGVRRVVLKNITGMGQEKETFAGGAIMGDGLVALVLDVEKVTGKSLTGKGRK